MSFEVYPTTAESIVGATDAALQLPHGVTEEVISQFLDVPPPSARNALKMATQLGLLEEIKAGVFTPRHPLAAYLVSGSLPARAAILRLVLEQYPPYKTFKQRLAVAGLAPDAATQTRALHQISAHREDILNTFVNLGTYSNSLISEGAGLFKPNEDKPDIFLSVAADAIDSKEAAELQVRRQLGAEASAWVSQQEVLDHLVTAYQRAASAKHDPRAPIVHAGNAIESFLVQLATAATVNLQNASGINAKADALHKAKTIATKHFNMLKYLGHVRNAADHGTDPDPAIGCTWIIAPSTAVQYVHVAISTIAAIEANRRGQFIV